MRVSRFCGALVTVLMLSTGWSLPSSAAGAEEKLKILVVTGGHGFEKDPFYKMFQDNPDIAFTAAEHSKTNASVYDRDDLFTFDVVVLYDMPKEITEPQKKNFLSLLEKGTGLVVLHHALVSYPNWPDYEKIIGGRYPEPDPKKPGTVTEQAGYQHDVDIPVVILATNHPITAGVTDFTINDEIYWGFRVRTDVTPLFTTTHPKSGKPLAWTRIEGKSRVVFMQLGHGPSAFNNPNYRKLLAQSIQWAANKPATRGTRASATPAISSGSIAVTVARDSKQPGRPIPSSFLGLSFEVAQLLPATNGQHYFRPGNHPLINLFHTLGIKSLRIGGNTSDRDAKQLPSEADIDSLFAFAERAGLKVIYCLQLHNGNPQAAAKTVKYILARYERLVDSFSIGQEPSAYPVQKRGDSLPNSERMGAAAEKFPYSAYRGEWERFADTIIAAAPGVRFCGPSVHNNSDWVRRFLDDFGESSHVWLVTAHLYPGGAGGKVPTPEIGRDRMLSDDFTKVYQKLHDGCLPAANSKGIQFRLEEVNNYFNGGAAEVSETFAAALWGLDFLHWWAAHDAAGVNFHTGDRVAAGSALRPSKYTAFFTTTNGYLARPLGYGIKAFSLATVGSLSPFDNWQSLPVSISSESNINFTAYGTRVPNAELIVTLINKEHGAEARAAEVTVNPGARYPTVETMVLRAPDNDIAAVSGVTLGGAPIRNDGTWNGSWAQFSGSANPLKLTVPAATAIIVRLKPG
jgi:type 1 glutamine amidotransferase